MTFSMQPIIMSYYYSTTVVLALWSVFNLLTVPIFNYEYLGIFLTELKDPRYPTAGVVLEYV